MSGPIDEALAWSLVRSVHPVSSPLGSPSRVTHHPRPDVWLQVHPSGRWEASGPVTDEARDLFDLYLPLQVRTPLVVAQSGQSVDGRTATETGHSHYVTGPADIRRLHRLRALVDAVIVGAGTVQADDPRLTVRGVDGDNPVRVILDPTGRLDAGRHVFTDGQARTIVVRRASAEAGGASGLHAGARGEEILALPALEGGVFPPAVVLEALRALELRRVLVEGGGATVSRFLEAGAVDRLHVVVAPVLIGSGRPAFTLTPIARLEEALRPPCRHFRLGDDVLFDFDFRPVNGAS